jgi:hypothetical protein
MLNARPKTIDPRGMSLNSTNHRVSVEVRIGLEWGVISLLDAVVAKEQAQGILLEAVIEVVNDVSLNGVDTIIDEAESGTLTGSGKVRLQGTGTGVLLADVIGIVGPG